MRTGSIACAALVAATLAAFADATAATGRTAGKFDVDADGAATYTMPIWVPPGPRGVQPRIAIRYNSQLGDDLAGVGWSIVGLSSIDRCNKRVAQDSAAGPITLTASDVYCLDGVRLRMISGSSYGADLSTYGTEVAEFSLITAHTVSGYGPGPAYFTVQGKDGLTYEYGNTATSKVVLGTAQTVLRWMLDKVSDRSGNSYTIDYTGTTYPVPSTIHWAPTTPGGAAYTYAMSFAYSTRSDKDSFNGYVAGYNITNTNLLQSITVQSSASSGTLQTVRKYSLTYNASASTSRSLLTTVVECADGAGTNCLSPTTFSYQSSVSSGTSRVAVSSSPNIVTGAFDFNGDGRYDILYVSGSTYYVTLSGASGYSTGVNTGIPSTSIVLVHRLVGGNVDGLLASISGVWWYYRWTGSAFTGTSTGISVGATYQTLILGAQFLLTDNNGDGLPDLVRVDPSTGKVYLRLNTTPPGNATPTFAASEIDTGITSTGNGLWSNYSPRTRRMDFNGDGREDTAIVTKNTVPYGWYLTETVLLATGTGYSAGQTLIGVVGPVNFDSDQCTDLGNAGSVQRSYCNGSAAATIAAPTGVFAYMDWDGDGKTDVVVPNGSYVGIQLSTSTGWSSVISTAIPNCSGCAYWATDADGDGLPDIAVLSGGGTSSTSLTVYLHTNVGFVSYPAPSSAPNPDVATSMSDGVVTYGLGYVSTAAGAYTAGSATTYPVIDATTPRIVVGTVSFMDEIGGTYTKNYWYTGAKEDAQGRGFLGFQIKQTTDNRPGGLIEKAYYEQAFPKTGMVYQDDIYQSNGQTLVSHASYTNTVTTLDSTAYNQRYATTVTQSSVARYEVGGTKNGLLISTASDAYTYDSWGNVTKDIQTRIDNDSSSPYVGYQWKRTVDTTIPNPSSAISNWCVTLPTQVVVTETAPSDTVGSGAATVTHTTSLTPDYVKCRETQVVAEPSNSSYAVTTALAFDDATGGYGNVSSQTVTGANMTGRITQLGWGTRGIFPESLTNALTQTSQRHYNYDLGVADWSKDPSLIQTSWQSDAFGRKYIETRPDGTKTQWDYLPCATSTGCYTGQHWMTVKETHLNVDGSTLTDGFTYLDKFNRPIVRRTRLLDGTYQWQETQYDVMGRVKQQGMPCATGSATASCTAYWTTIGYDAISRPTSTQRPVNAANSSTLQSTTTKYAGRTTTVTDALGQTSVRLLDINGWLRTTTDANGYALTFSYDAAGSLTAVKDSSSNTLFTGTYDYGISAFQRTVNDMDRGAWSYTYDALGELTNWGDAKLQSFSQFYDALSRPYVRTEPGNTTSWIWGNSASSFNIGQLQSISSTEGGSYSQTMSYDSYGRLASKTIVIPSDASYSYAYTYNANTGLADTLTYPLSTSGYRLKLQYGYQNGVLYKVSDYNAPTTVFWQTNATTARGQVSQETLGNGVVTNRAFDAVTGWANAIQSGVGGGTGLQNASYLYDWEGNITQRQNNKVGLTEDFYYDNLYRLDHSTLNGTLNLQMCYDNPSSGTCTQNLPGPGDITSRSDVASGGYWTYDATKKHAVRQAGSSAYTYSYDANGNAVTRNGSTIGWTSYNYPSSVAAGSEVASFAYGPDRARWQMNYTDGVTYQVTRYVGELLEKVTVGSVSDYRHYIRGGGQTVAVYSRKSDGTNTLTYVLSDHQQSIDTLASSSGTSVANESFAAFGNRRSAATWSGTPSDRATLDGITRQGYTFQTVLGAMGLNHMNGRVQDAVTGRFLSPDPLNADPGNTQGFNRYSYVNNNPLTHTDPSGFCEQNFPGCFDIESIIAMQPNATIYSSNGTYYGGFGWGPGSVYATTTQITYTAGGQTYTSRDIIDFRVVGNSELVAAFHTGNGNFWVADGWHVASGFQQMMLENYGSFGAQMQFAVSGAIGTLRDAINIASLLGPAGVERGAAEAVLVIGRQIDTAVAKDWAGHAIIDIADWSVAKNDVVIQSAIDARETVYLASPTTAENLFDAVAGRTTAFGRELQQFLDAGYTRVGDYLLPPGGP